MNALHKQNIGEEETVSEISQETGSKASDNSLAVFPSSIDDTILKITNFMSDYYGARNGNIALEHIVEYNKHCTPQLGDGELEELYERTAQKLSHNDIDIILQTFKSNKTEATYLIAEYIVKKYNIITIGEKEREMFI